MHLRTKILLLILIFFLFIGIASATQDINKTTGITNNDTANIVNENPIENNSNIEYNHTIPEDTNLTVKQKDAIHVEIRNKNSSSNTIQPILKVYIDNKKIYETKESYILIDSAYNIPISSGLNVGTHNITFEFQYKNHNWQYLHPEFHSEYGKLIIRFNETLKLNQSQNITYRFNSKLNVIKKLDSIITTINNTQNQITLSYTDNLPIDINCSDSGQLNIIINNEIHRTYLFDESEHIQMPTSEGGTYFVIFPEYLPVGTYNITFEFIFNNKNTEYLPTFQQLNTTSSFKFEKTGKTDYPYDYIYRFNTILNIVEIKNETIIVNSDITSYNITYKHSIIIYSPNWDNLKVNVDDKVLKDYYNYYISPFYPIIYYVPYTPDTGNKHYLQSYYLENETKHYIEVGSHNLKFEVKFTKQHVKYIPKLSIINSTLYFEFDEGTENEYLSDYTYVFNLTLNVLERPNIEPVSINNDELKNITIKRSEEIPYIIKDLENCYLTIFLDDDIIFESETHENEFSESILTYISSNTVFEKNILDIKEGKYNLKFELYIEQSRHEYLPKVYMLNSTLYFELNPYNYISPKEHFYQFNTTLEIIKKNKTVHITDIENASFFCGPDVILTFDEFVLDEDNFTNFGVIISNESGIIRIYDDCDNGYDYEYDDENNGIFFAWIQTWDDDEDGSYLIYLNTGKYNLTIINFYDGTNDTKAFNIKKEKAEITNLDIIPESFTISISVENYQIVDNNPPILTISVEDKIKKINLNDEMDFYLEFYDMLPGDYTVNFYYPGNRNYYALNFTEEVTVYKEDCELSQEYEINDDNIDFYINANIPKSEGTITVQIGENIKKIHIKDEADELKVSFKNLKPGDYEAIISFLENEKYYFSTISVDFTIPETTAPDDNITQDNETNSSSGNGTGDSNQTGNGNGTMPNNNDDDGNGNSDDDDNNDNNNNNNEDEDNNNNNDNNDDNNNNNEDEDNNNNNDNNDDENNNNNEDEDNNNNNDNNDDDNNPNDNNDSDNDNKQTEQNKSNEKNKDSGNSGGSPSKSKSYEISKSIVKSSENNLILFVIIAVIIFVSILVLRNNKEEY